MNGAPAAPSLLAGLREGLNFNWARTLRRRVENSARSWWSKFATKPRPPISWRKASKLAGAPQAKEVGPRKSKAFPVWHSVFSSLQEVYNPDNLPLDVYRQMAITDETISACLEYICLTVVGYLGECKVSNERQQKYINRVFEKCDQTLPEIVKGILESCTYGFAVGERVLRWDEETNQVILDSLPFLDPLDIRFAVGVERGKWDYGKVIGVRQLSDGQAKIIPVSRLLIATHNAAGEFGNPYGRSRLKSVYKSWVIKDALLKYWSMALERYGSPIGVAKITNGGNKVTLPDGRTLDKKEAMLEALTSLTAGDGLVVDVGEDISLDTLGQAVGKDFEQAQNHLNKCLMRGLAIPALLMEPTDIGSFALGQKHFELFLRSIRDLVGFVSQILVKQVIQPLLELNFANPANVCFEGLTEEIDDLEKWSKIVFALQKAGFVDNQDVGDINEVRYKINFPAVTKPISAPMAIPGDSNLPSHQSPGGAEKTDGPPQPRGPKVPGAAEGRPSEVSQ